MCSRVDGRTACPCMLGVGAVPLEPHLCFLGVDSSNQSTLHMRGLMVVSTTHSLNHHYSNHLTHVKYNVKPSSHIPRKYITPDLFSSKLVFPQ